MAPKLHKRPPYYGPVIRSMLRDVSADLARDIVTTGCFGHLYKDRDPDTWAPLVSLRTPTCPRDGKRDALCPIRKHCRDAWHNAEGVHAGRLEKGELAKAKPDPDRVAAIQKLRKQLFSDRENRRGRYVNQGRKIDFLAAAFLEGLGQPPVIYDHFTLQSQKQKAAALKQLGPLFVLAPKTYLSVYCYVANIGSENGVSYGDYVMGCRFWTSFNWRARVEMLPEVERLAREEEASPRFDVIPEKQRYKHPGARARVFFDDEAPAKRFGELVPRAYGIDREEIGAWGRTARGGE